MQASLRTKPPKPTSGATVTMDTSKDLIIQNESRECSTVARLYVGHLDQCRPTGEESIHAY